MNIHFGCPKECAFKQKHYLVSTEMANTVSTLKAIDKNTITIHLMMTNE